MVGEQEVRWQKKISFDTGTILSVGENNVNYLYIVPNCSYSKKRQYDCIVIEEKKWPAEH